MLVQYINFLQNSLCLHRVFSNCPSSYLVFINMPNDFTCFLEITKFFTCLWENALSFYQTNSLLHVFSWLCKNPQSSSTTDNVFTGFSWRLLALMYFLWKLYAFLLVFNKRTSYFDWDYMEINSVFPSVSWKLLLDLKAFYKKP